MSEKWVQLIDQIIEHSKTDDINWKETSDEASIQTTIAGYNIVIELIDLLPEYFVRIYDKRGKVADQFDGSDIQKLTGASRFGEIDYIVKREKRKQSGADATIDEIINELGKIISF